MVEHTKGLRVEIHKWSTRKTASVETDATYGDGETGRLSRKDLAQAKADADYINTLIEQDEARQAAFEELGKSDVSDVLVNLGDMSGARLNSIKLDGDYEAMVEDVLQCLNNMLAQGVSPIRGLYALVQATAIALGCALRANMDFEIARSLVAMIMRTASTSEKMFRVIQGQPRRG